MGDCDGYDRASHSHCEVRDCESTLHHDFISRTSSSKRTGNEIMMKEEHSRFNTVDLQTYLDYIWLRADTCASSIHS